MHLLCRLTNNAIPSEAKNAFFIVITNDQSNYPVGVENPDARVTLCWAEYFDLIKWCCCVKPNKRGLVSVLLGPHQHALARM